MYYVGNIIINRSLYLQMTFLYLFIFITCLLLDNKTYNWENYQRIFPFTHPNFKLFNSNYLLWMSQDEHIVSYVLLKFHWNPLNSLGKVGRDMAARNVDRRTRDRQGNFYNTPNFGCRDMKTNRVKILYSCMYIPQLLLLSFLQAAWIELQFHLF